MKFFSVFFLLIILLSTKAISHSGGTDRNGCHAGSEPYHCHSGENTSGRTSSSGSSHSDNDNDNDSSYLSAWDFNIGYQYHIEDTQFIPYAGLSMGRDKIYEKNSDEFSIGLDLGLKLQKGWYLGYASTSKSVKFGYRFVHLSVNSNFIGKYQPKIKFKKKS